MTVVQAGFDVEGLFGLILFVAWIGAQIAGAVRKKNKDADEAARGAPPAPAGRPPAAEPAPAGAEMELSKFLEELRRASEGLAAPARAEPPPVPGPQPRPAPAGPTLRPRPARRRRMAALNHGAPALQPPPVPGMSPPAVPVPDLQEVALAVATPDTAPPAFHTGAHGSQGLSMPTLRMPTLRQPGLRAGLAFQMPVMHSRGSWMTTMRTLRNPRGIRTAMVAREIIGPPRAFTPPPGA